NAHDYPLVASCCCHDLLGGASQVGICNDVQAAFRQHFGAQFSVVTLQTNHNRYFNANFFHSTDYTFGNHVATHDTTKDIDEYGFYVGVRQDDLERFNHTLFGRTTAHIKEVSRLTAVQLHDVHGTHGQTGTVYHAADVAIQCHVVQFPLGSMSFARIFLRRVTHGLQVFVTVQSVAVDHNFGIQTVQVAFVGDHQRVDFQQGQVFVLEQLGQAQENVGELLDLIPFQTQLECQLTALVSHSANQRINSGFQNFFRRFFRYFFNFHAALSRGHKNNTTRGTVYHRTQIQFLGDVGAAFYQNATDRLTFLISLISHQVFTQPLIGEFFDFFFRRYQFHTTGLTTATGMYLCFNNPAATANGVGCSGSFFRGLRSHAFGNRQAVLSKKLFTLIFVKVHRFCPVSLLALGVPNRLLLTGQPIVSAVVNTTFVRP